jgi:sugar-phosphatase
MTAFDAAIFDMDGLLVDSEPLWREVEIAVFARHGVALTDSLCCQTKGMFLPDVARYWYERHRWDGPGPDEVADEIVDAMETRLAGAAVLKEGADHALAFCAERGMRLALASSSPRRLIDVVVTRFGLRSRFAVIHSAEDEPAGKPDPGIFLTTARLLGVEPARCVVFEDAAAGVAAAKAAGMRCVAVPERGDADEGDPVRDLGGMAADVVLGSLAELGDDVLGRLDRNGSR